MYDNIIVRESSAELKGLSKMALRGIWINAVIGVVIYQAMVTLVPGVISALIPSLNYVYSYPEVPELTMTFSPLVYIYRTVLVGPFLIGFNRYILNVIRRREVDYNLLFSGFRNFVNSFLLQFLIAIFVLIWSLPFVAIGAVGTVMGVSILSVIAPVGTLVLVIWAYLRYAVASYFMADDSSLSPMACINLSKTKMEGNKGKYLYIVISFFGWMIVANLLPSVISALLPTLGLLPNTLLSFVLSIPVYFVTLYMQCTLGFFYEILSGHLRKEV